VTGQGEGLHPGGQLAGQRDDGAPDLVLTTRELAARSGLAPATVNAVELGVRVPSVIVLLRLAAELQVPRVALVEPAHEEAERLVREAWVMPVAEVSVKFRYPCDGC
jgi:transcriptional regulator with XRE-family HTH domain